MARRSITLRIRRSSPGEGRRPAFVEYEVPVVPKMTMLDAVSWVQGHRESSLAFRYACRVGMCGTCACVINGREGWMCRTLVELQKGAVITLEPLRNFPIIKDLVVDMEPFFGALDRAMGYFVSDAATSDVRSLADRPRIDPHIECISCGACYSACTMLAWDPLYLGPAALNRAATLVRDSRDAAHEVRLRAVDDEHGCWRCHSQFTCTDVCPMHLRPTESIGYLKRTLVARGVQAAIGVKPAAPPASPPRRSFWRPLVVAAVLSLIIGSAYLASVRAQAGTASDQLYFSTNDPSPQVLAGALLFEQGGCDGCHAVLGRGARQAPDLWKTGRKHDRAWLRQVLTDPDSVVSKGVMPPYDLAPRELDALVEYLHQLDFSRARPVQLPRSAIRSASTGP